MSDSADQKLEILIKTIADTAGIQMTDEQLSGLKSTLGKYTEEVKGATNEQEKHLISHRALHQALHLLGTQAGPQATAAMAGLIAVLGGGGIGIGIFAVRELMEALGQARERAEEARLELVKMGDEGGRAVQELKDAAKEFQDALTLKNADAASKSAFAVLLQQIKDAKAEADALIDKLKKAGLLSDKDESDAKRKSDAAALIGERDAKTAELEKAITARDAIQKNKDLIESQDQGSAAAKLQDRKFLQAAIDAASKGTFIQPYGDLGLGEKSLNPYAGPHGSAEENLQYLLGLQDQKDRADAEDARHRKAVTDALTKFSDKVNALTGDIESINQRLRTSSTMGKIGALDPEVLSSALANRSRGITASAEQQAAVAAFVDLEKQSGASNAQVIQLCRMLVSGQISMQQEMINLGKRLQDINNHPH